MKKLQLGMQILAAILFVLPAVVSIFIVVSTPIGIMLAILSLILTGLAFAEGKLSTVFLIAIPGVCLVLAGYLHLLALNINNSGNGQGAALGAAIADASAVFVLIYSITTGLGSALALIARSVTRQSAERGTNERE